jgi:hypothetical protein
MHGSRNKIPSKKSRQATLHGWIKFRRSRVKQGIKAFSRSVWAPRIALQTCWRQPDSIPFSWYIYSKFLKCLHYEHFTFWEITFCEPLAWKNSYTKRLKQVTSGDLRDLGSKPTCPATDRKTSSKKLNNVVTEMKRSTKQNAQCSTHLWDCELSERVKVD